MLTLVRQQLTQYFPQQTNFFIGLSGGVDSVVLLTLFAQLRQTQSLNLRCVHIHHGLSPNADSWAEFCKTLCQKLDIPLIIKKVKVTGKQGLEANARQARYQAIQSLIHHNEVFVTAHHLDDQVETFFLALKRGSGVKGLSAMQAVSYWQNFTLFRPLLSVSKADILCYAEQAQLNWIEDESNQNIEFDRNFLRQEVLPLFNQRWQHFNQMVMRTSQHCAEQQQLLAELLNEELYSRFNLSQKSLNIEGFSHFSVPKQRQLIRLWLEKCQMPMPSQTQLDEILSAVIQANTDKNPQIMLGQSIIRRYQQRLFITEEIKSIPPFQSQLNIGENITLPAHIGNIERTATELICHFSQQSYRLPLAEELQKEPLTIKLQHTGKVKCYGKTQREEMKKIWQKNSVPVWERPRTPLVFYNDELVMLLQPFYKIEKQAIKTDKAE